MQKQKPVCKQISTEKGSIHGSLFGVSHVMSISKETKMKHDCQTRQTVFGSIREQSCSTNTAKTSDPVFSYL